MPKLLKFGLVFAWFPASFVFLISLIIFYQFQTPVIQSPPSTVAADLPGTSGIEPQILGVKIDDLRPIKIQNFLKGTPLVSYSDYMVEMSDKYGIDYRFIPAIAMKESGAGRAIPEGSFNAWGFENGRTRFASWESAIEAVAKTLRYRYIDKGLTTPDEIMPVYAPPAMENGGGWATAVNDYLAKMERPL